jgi:nucleolar pre-ribosomal-associated protein 1
MLVGAEYVMLQNATLLSLCVSTLAALLSLLSQHYIYHSLADEIIRRILDPNVMRRLNSYLGKVQHETMIATLKLFNALVDFADGREKRSVLDNFAWGMKVCRCCR